MRTIPILLTVLLLAPLAAVHAAEPWWREYTPVATVGLRAESLETIQPGAARGVGTLGWYGFWFLDAQEREGHLRAVQEKMRQVGAKQIVYYDIGEVGDYATFFSPDGQLKCNGWSLPFYKGDSPLTARWLGLQAFMQDVGGGKTKIAFVKEEVLFVVFPLDRQLSGNFLDKNLAIM